MNLLTVMPMLKVLLLTREMPMGEGWETIPFVVEKSGVAHSTAYRNMKKMEVNKLVESRKFHRGGLKCYEYRITEDGRNLVNSQNALFIIS